MEFRQRCRERLHKLIRLEAPFYQKNDVDLLLEDLAVSQPNPNIINV